MPAEVSPMAESAAGWGARWLRQLEDASPAYANRFSSSRRLAGAPNMVDFDISPGHVHARVVDKRGEIHTVDIAVRLLSEGEKEDLVEQVAARAENLASMLDGELPAALIDAIGELEIDAFARPSDLRPDCSCDDWAEPCLHAGAVLVALARSLDRDPFVLFDVRGLPREQLLSRVREARSTSTDSPKPLGEVIEQADPWDGWTADRALGTRPTRGDTAQTTKPEPILEGALGEILSRARSDAAFRAREVIRYGRPSMLAIPQLADLARIASSQEWVHQQRVITRASGLSGPEVDALIEAWRKASVEGVTVLRDSSTWARDQQALSQARDQLVDAGFERREIALSYNSLGLGQGRLLVLGTSEAWYLLSEGDRRTPMRLRFGPLDDLNELSQILARTP